MLNSFYTNEELFYGIYDYFGHNIEIVFFIDFIM